MEFSMRSASPTRRLHGEFTQWTATRHSGATVEQPGQLSSGAVLLQLGTAGSRVRLSPIPGGSDLLHFGYRLGDGEEYQESRVERLCLAHRDAPRQVADSLQDTDGPLPAH